MSKKEMMQELLEKMSEKEIRLLYCFAIGMRAGSTEKPEAAQEGEKNHDEIGRASCRERVSFGV